MTLFVLTSQQYQISLIKMMILLGRRTFVNAIFDANLKGSQNPQTIALFRKLKEDRDPQLVDVNSLLDAFIMKHVEMKTLCDVAHSYGMRFPGDTTPQPTHDIVGGGKRIYDAGQKSTYHEKKLKGDEGNDLVCQHCGVIGHLKAQCRKIKDTSKYFNCLNVPYEDSEAWKRVQRDVKDALKTLGYPRFPKHDSVFLAANAKYGAPNPKTGIPPKNFKPFSPVW